VRDSHDGWHSGVSFGSGSDAINLARTSRLAAYGPGAAPPRSGVLCEAAWPPHLAASCDASLVTAPLLFSLRNDGSIGFVMIGSHVLAPSAWGKLSPGGGVSGVGSFELSVVITPQSLNTGCEHEAALVASGKLRESAFTVKAGSPPQPQQLVFLPDDGSAADAAVGVVRLPIPCSLPPQPYPPPPNVPGFVDAPAGQKAEEGLVDECEGPASQPEPYVKSGGTGVFLTADAEGRTNPATWSKHGPGCTKGGSAVQLNSRYIDRRAAGLLV